MANNFRWFDQKSKVIDTPSGQQYIPQQQGALSLIGQSLQGIAAPFAGDYDFGRRQVEMQLRQQQADNEFRAMLEKNRMMSEENQAAANNRPLSNLLMARALGVEVPNDAIQQALQKSGVSLGPQMQQQGAAQGSTQMKPPIGVTGGYISQKGGASLRLGETPENRRSAELLQANRKEFKTNINNIASYFNTLNQLEEAATAVGGFDQGIIPQAIGKAKVGADLFSKEPNITRYNKLIKQTLPGFSDVAGVKGSQSDRDIKNLMEGFSDYTAPLETKLQMTRDAKERALQTGLLELEKAGYTIDDLQKQAPEAYKLIFGASNGMNQSDKKTLDYNALTGKTTPKDTNSKFKKLFGI